MSIKRAKIRGFERISASSSTVSLPTRNDEGSSGYDIYAPVSGYIKPGETLKVFTQIKVYCRKDEEFLIFPRSSMAIKNNITIKNTIGKIDSSYYNNPDNEGEIIVALKNEGTEHYWFNLGDKIAQGSFYKYLRADNDVVLNSSRVGGVGSSGR